MTSAIHGHLSRQQAKARERDNAIPRPARVRFIVKTSGIGESRLVGAAFIPFGAYMIDEPTLSYGLVTIDPLRVGELPLATATVLRWRLTSNGLYAGAEMGFKVESMLNTIRLKFTLTFEGSTLRTTAGQGTETIVAPQTNKYRGSDTVDPGAL